MQAVGILIYSLAAITKNYSFRPEKITQFIVLDKANALKRNLYTKTQIVEMNNNATNQATLVSSMSAKKAGTIIPPGVIPVLFLYIMARTAPIKKVIRTNSTES